MMNHRVLELALASALACAAVSAGAQGLRVPASPSAPAAGAAPAGLSQRPADYIVAVVNSEPITNNQVRQEMQRMARQLTQARRPVPEAREMAAQVLDLLINEKAQLQLAREYGLKIDDAAIDDAERTVARQNRVELEELYRRLAADGIARNQFRAQLRDQLLLLKVREREVNQKVRISDLEVDQYLRDQRKNADPALTELSMAHVLIGVPEDASAAQIAAAQAKAQEILGSARAGADFAALAREFSDAADGKSGGLTSLRRADRYPTLFVEVTQNMAPGEMTIVRSGAGFHVLKLIDKRAGGMPATSVVQTRASHILLLPSAQLGEAGLVEKLNALRKRIVDQQGDFATLAKENSQDGSAAQGGDLGWVVPGQLVPEFEEAMNALAPGQISTPLVSRFGVHLIKVSERRTVPLTQREQREAVRAVLRDKRLDEAYTTWMEALRGRTYVEMREPPG